MPNGKRIHTTASEVAKRTIQVLQIDSTVYTSEYIRYKSTQLCTLSMPRTLIKTSVRLRHQRLQQGNGDTFARCNGHLESEQRFIRTHTLAHTHVRNGRKKRGTKERLMPQAKSVPDNFLFAVVANGEDSFSEQHLCPRIRHPLRQPTGSL